MARLDYIKNVTGLVEWYAKYPRLRELANLLVVAGTVEYSHSGDDEERKQIRLMENLIKKHKLDGQFRWVEAIHDKNIGGELYRFVADSKGIFVQPALFEAFGLTVVEAMVSGLPTFATRYGGPLEIIEDGVSGFHIDPNQGTQTAEFIADFFERCKEEPQYWDQISNEGIQRVEERYTWELYAKRLMSLSRIYGFWKYITKIERQETNRYLEMFYNLMFKRQAIKIESEKEYHGKTN